ncbi:hypothetical protein EVJ58_g10175 [Rhodofomes roseus]|uniref:BTB domain-containing protein n=1 Tax=Rhodofomes roseus TaxID=34475 RepID=A0A4Y9XRY0_9APHY|nr:hypothetical protein EVJ58_g10175 [Rhodofomes roseus]
MAESHPKCSERFCSPDSDNTVSSSDGVLFKLHRTNLGVHSDIFPGVEANVPVQDEIVALEEEASTLELLFQYVYPQRQPDLSKLNVRKLALLAEAAEKYSVYSAMEVCRLYMQAAKKRMPMEVLMYAARHGYTELCDEAAPYTLDADAAVALKVMESDLVKKWVSGYNVSSVGRPTVAKLILTAHPDVISRASAMAP